MLASFVSHSLPRLICKSCLRSRTSTLSKAVGALSMKCSPIQTQFRLASESRGDFEKATDKTKETQDESSIFIDGKYTIFQDEDAEVILDVDEERSLHAQGFRPKKKEREREDFFAGINLERGVHGVFDIEDLVEVLRKNNARSVFVATLPEELNYASHIVVVTGKSVKHMNALADFIRRVYKRKVQSQGQIPHIEGGESKDWKALDLGNIILHIMSKEARELYDLESLWSVGHEYDGIVNTPDDEVITLLQEHTYSLDGFQPASTPLPPLTKKDKN